MSRATKTFARALVVSALLPLGLVAVVNAVTDPLGMYRWVDVAGFNASKPAIYNRVRLLKAYETRRQTPDSVVLGSSRVHLGIRPTHLGWAGNFRRAYNLAFDGATTKEMYHYLVHAHAAGPLRHVILGLDSYHLIQVPGATRPGFDPGLLLTDNRWLHVPRVIAADLKLLISANTLQETFNTLVAQRRATPEWLAPNGQRLGEVYFRRPEDSFQKVGPRRYFDEIDRQEVGFMLGWRIPAARPRSANTPPAEAADPVTSLGYVEKIVDYCRRHGIDLSIFLTPAHAHQLELTAATGGWWALENGKRQLVALIAEDAQRYPDRDPIRIVDFSGYSSVTTEPLPRLGSRREMRFYWDSSHFKENVGDWVLDRLLDTGAAAARVPDDFGRALTAATVEQVIAEDRIRQAAYRRAQPQDIRAIEQWVAEFKRENGIVD